MEENKKTAVNTEVKNTEVKTEGRRNDNRNRKFDKKKPRNNNRTSKPKSDLEDKVIEIRRVTKVVKGGRRFRFAALVVVGDRKGRVGVGTGKANEVPDAIKKAVEDAKKNIFTVPVIGTTIPHEITGRYGAGSVYMRPAIEGTGVIAGGATRAILELAGISDILTKCLGSRTKINVVRATVDGLQNLRTVESVAALRGKKPEEIRG